ncbi:DNA alkylation repair protein [Amnibacterium flavum]|uniref:DNA alkylation repair protein n=1 Tax=Amnibacterium flavum TaxID=2173173 RepID=A0A2V1HQY9_9MICO|nr:DNA alkylation repair protein [Amnibacterium flavum]PVZ94761.1 DNA alkylation repair protein [Amnibacterium flavum]
MPFADELIGIRTAQALVDAIDAAAPGSRLPALREAATRLDDLSLRERADLLRDALLRDIPGDYAQFASVIRAARDGELPFSGWLIWPVTGAVAQKAVEESTDASFDDAMDLLADLTSRLTAEFAIRVLLRHDLPRALETARRWTGSADTDVRRLASEGTRPYLPWSVRVPAIIVSPGSTVPILDALYRDPSDYVRRSVANHLNDLSRDAPDLVVGTARRWLENPDENTPGVVRHGLRTLIKKGNRGALELLGFTPASVDVVGPVLSAERIGFGGSIDFRATIINTGLEPARLAVDYTVHHQKANGQLTGKTFKLTTVMLAPGEATTLNRTHSFRPITTRRYHPGEHAIELQVNGVRHGRTTFVLEAPDD